MGMKLQYNLENIGNIDKASITIKRLTIIAGENSTGKTFVTKSLYTILNSVYQDHFSNKVINKYIHLKHSYSMFYDNLTKPSSIDKGFSEKMLIFENEIYKIIFELIDVPFEEEEKVISNNYNIFDTFEKSIREYFSERLKLKKFKKYSHDIELILNHLNDFSRMIKERREIVIESIDSSLARGLKKNYQITDLKSLINRKNNQKLKLAIDTIGEIEVDLKSKLTFNFEGQGIEKIQKIENIVFFDSPVYIKIRKALESNQRNAFIRLKDEEKYLKGYPEYLDKLYGFVDKEYIDVPDFSEISNEIQSIISGKLDITKSGDINYTDNQNNTIPLSLTAMGISNIGLIDLLLRNNVINKGSFLIMDEPEVHLHPEWQVILAQLLYKIAKSGANIIIATHSLDFLKAFENILKEENEIAEETIAINKMPYHENFSEKNELEKVGIVLDDLSRPFYNLYMQDI
jgi:predicted ATPase